MFGSLAASLLTTLSVCETGVDLLLENEASTTLIQQCQNEVEALPLSIEEKKLGVSSQEKSSLLASTDRLYKKLEDVISLQLQDTVSLSSLVTLQNRVLILEELLRSQETWQANWEGGSGMMKFGNSKSVPVLKIFSQFNLDSGKTWEALVRLSLNTPLNEETGYVILPIREADAVNISQAWLRHKFFSRVKLQLGIFPDKHYSAPEEWPFLSTQAEIDFFKMKKLSFHLDLRHDRRDIYAPDFHKPTSINLERTLTQAVLKYESRFPSVTLISGLKGRLNWYGDPNRQLASLSTGRPRYFESEIAKGDSLYRVMEWNAFFSARTSMFELSENVSYLRNLLERPIPEGWMSYSQFSVTPSSHARYWIAHSFQNLECGVAPPIQLGTRWMPGLATQRLEFGTEHALRPRVVLRFLSDWELSSMAASTGTCAVGGAESAQNERLVSFLRLELNYFFDNTFM